MAIGWPPELSPRIITPELQAATQSGGRSITGHELVVAPDAGYWKIVLDQIPVASRTQKLHWRALSALLKGRLNICDVPVLDSQWQSPESVTAQLASDAALGVVALSILMTAGSYLEPGRAFSFDNGSGIFRLHRIKKIVSSDVEGGGTGTILYSVKVSPPLREAISSGLSLNFDSPVCSCRLATDREMQSALDHYAGQGLGKITFEEAILP